MNSGRRVAALIAALVVARAVLPLWLLAPAWEYHRDELLYFAMGDHLAWRMQFPPFIAGLAKLSTLAFGDSVWAARVPAALGGAALTGVVLCLLRRLGAGAWAMVLAWLGLALAPVFLRSSVLFQPVVFDQLWATLAVAALVLASTEDSPRWWLLVGAALGCGLLTKMSSLMYGAAILAVALLHPGLRRHLVTPWPWAAAATALLLGAPTLVGQMHHGWPFLQQLDTLKQGQFAHTSVLGTLAEQPLLLMPAALMVGAALFARERLRAASIVAGGFAVGLLALVLWQGGKAYYAAPAYPVLIGLGAAVIASARRRWLIPGAASAMLALGVPVLPMGVPMLGPSEMAAYATRLGVGTTTNRGVELTLPQDYADMLGWRAKAEAVARAYGALSEADRAEVVIVGGNYGQAGALARYVARFGYPYPVSTAGDFHAWGPGSRSGKVLLLLAGPDARADLEAFFARVEEVDALADPRAVPEERDVRIFVAREPRASLADVWPSLGPNW
ncbi:MAG: glycosyltransferase family 39 protein [Gemmatimonadaceae bacterium]|nr:glycosyltransferase family 39 protein [Gemmatimonadaceae bacterium]MCW5825106.1 glycosyltransferase family 39 protein [Gemmatimonadaceae bacterium]